MPDRSGPPLCLALAEPLAAGGDAWRTLALVAERLCRADAAGVSTPFGAERPAIGALARRLARGEPVATMADDTGSHLAGAAIAGIEGPMLWVERAGAPFDRPSLARLGWLAAGGTAFRDALDAARDEADLLLSEVRHRCANDLHLVGSLLSHQARFAGDDRIAAGLEAVAGRVMMLSRARQQPPGDLVAGLRACTDALAAQVGDRGIAVGLTVRGSCPPIDERRAAVLLLAANELAVNALKHAFAGGGGGRVSVTLAAGPALIALTVEDDGAPLPAGAIATRPGSGLDLVGRLVTGIRATLVPPPPGSKRFAVEMQVARAAAHRRDQ